MTGLGNLQAWLKYELHRITVAVTLCAFIALPLSHSVLWADTQSSTLSSESVIDLSGNTTRINEVDAINRLNTSNVNPELTSLAASYTSPLNSQVNPRTGELQIVLSPPTLSGFLGSNITPSISYQQSKVSFGEHMLGLPLGWSFPFSYIYKGRVFINGEQSYAIDLNPESHSGLQYYKLKNVVFKSCDRTPLSFDNTRYYFNTLRFHTGETHYFDSQGRVIGIDDRFGNHVLFYYKGDGNVYKSTLDKIVNSYGQEITFFYSETGIKVTYPTGNETNITFSFLTGADRLRLTHYVDPVGNQITITNDGGKIKKNLVSKITYPNGLNIEYSYNTIKYKKPMDFSTLDVVSSVKKTYQSQTRTTTFNYNPHNNQHYYTAYPKDFVATTGDPLLESHDNTFRYSTLVNDGIFVTEHIYNHLHLELERIIFTQNQKKINHTIYTYGEYVEQVFPIFRELPLNFQTPSCVVSKVYNDEGKERTYKVENKLNDYGNLIRVKSFESNTSGIDLVLKSEVIMRYDDYGQLLQKDLVDHTSSTQNHKRILNDLTADNKAIKTSTSGSVDGNTFKPSKMATYNYDNLGRIIFEKIEWVDGQQHTPMSMQNSISYHLSGNILTETLTNAQGKIVMVKKNALMGWLMSQTDALGHTTSYTYDNLGRKTTETDPMNVTTTRVYDDKSNKISTEYANGYKSFSTYNGFGDPFQFSDILVEKPHNRILSTKTYNDKGQLEEERGILGKKSSLHYTYSDRGELQTITDALGNTTRYDYDPVERWRKESFNDHFVEQIDFDSHHHPLQEHFLSTSGQEILASAGYNGFEKLISQRLGDKDTGQVWIENRFAYDEEDQLLSHHLEGYDGILAERSITRDLFGNNIQNAITVTQPHSAQQTTNSDLFIFNDLNQLTEERNPLNQSYQYTYDEVGRPTTYTDYTNKIFTYTYYPNHMIKSETHLDNSGRTRLKEYTYDPHDYTLKSIQSSYDGQDLESMNYTFTSDKKPKSITYPDGKQVTLDYDEQKALISKFTDALGQETQYVYDDYGRLYQAISKNQAITITYYSKQEDPLQSGKIKTLEMQSGRKNVYTYYPNGKLKNLTVLNHNNALLTIDYTYEPTTQNLTSIKYNSMASPNDPNVNCTIEYGFNTLNQLVTETVHDVTGKIKTSTYSYDAANNISQITTTLDGEKTVSIYEYDEDNKLIQITEPSGVRLLRYDTNGSLSDDGAGHLFTYNEKNQLIGFQDKKKGLEAEYTYYPNGLRKSKKIAGHESIVFYYDFWKTPNIVNEVQGNKSTNYLMIGNQRYLRLLNNGQAIIAQEYVQDSKDVTALLDQQGQFQKSYGYEAYGDPRNIAPEPTLLGIENNPFQYASEYTDAESGLIYLRTRFYNPDIKQFITRDKAHTINRYNYAESNPVMFTDPTGQGFWLAALAVIVITALTVLVVWTVVNMMKKMHMFPFKESGRDSSDDDSGSDPEPAPPKKKPSSPPPAPPKAKPKPSLSREQAWDLFRRSNPGLSGSTTDDELILAIRVAYPELELQSGLPGGVRSTFTFPNDGGEIRQGDGMRDVVRDIVTDLRGNNDGNFRPSDYTREGHSSTIATITHQRVDWDLDFQGMHRTEDGISYARFALQNQGRPRNTYASVRFRTHDHEGNELSYSWFSLFRSLRASIQEDSLTQADPNYSARNARR